MNYIIISPHTKMCEGILLYHCNLFFYYCGFLFLFQSKVRFASRLKLIKPIEFSKAEYEKQLTLCLYENYPRLRFHIMKANEINEKYYKDYPEFRIRFQPNFTWSDDGLDWRR